jgi:hypothetical protein
MGKYIHLGLIEIYYYQMFSRFISSTFSYSHFSILTNAISQGLHTLLLFSEVRRAITT